MTAIALPERKTIAPRLEFPAWLRRLRDPLKMLSPLAGSLTPLGVSGALAASPLLTDLVINIEGSELSGTRTDSTGRGNNLTAAGTAPGAVVFGAPGIQNYAATFNHNFSQYLYSADKSDLRFGGGITWTVECWIWGASGVGDVYVSKILGSTNEFLLYSSGGNVIARVYTDAGAGFYDANRPNPSNRAWHQVIAWFDGSKIYNQIDGGTIAETAVTGAIVNGNSQFQVGNYQSGSLYFDGRISPVRKWNRVLTLAERALLYNSGYGKVYPFSATPSSASARVFVGFPVMLRTSGGTFRLYWTNANNHILENAVIQQASSTDFATWTRGSNLESGENLGAVAAMEISGGNLLRFNSQGLTPSITNKVYVSADAGATWDSGTTITNPLSSWLALYGRPYQLAGGRILLPAYGENTGETTRAVVLKSDNSGASWSLLGTIGYDGTGTNNYNETSIVNTGGSNWFAIMRADVESDGANTNFRTATSTDDGATWSALSDVGFAGNAPELAYDGSGNLFLFYRDRANTNTSYRKSTDNGATWSAATVLNNDSSADCAYPSAVFNGTTFYVAYYRESGTDIQVWSKASASM